nr:MAG TPA: hypothetical protein [Caudoviricetes sp.]
MPSLASAFRCHAAAKPHIAKPYSAALLCLALPCYAIASLCFSLPCRCETPHC